MVTLILSLTIIQIHISVVPWSDMLIHFEVAATMQVRHYLLEAGTGQGSPPQQPQSLQAGLSLA